MSDFLNKLERKAGRKAIPNLINYMLVLYAAGTLLNIFAPALYSNYLSLNWGMILHGQVWRIVTFMLTPYPLTSVIRILFFAITVHLYFLFGTALEREWGTFKFNVFVFGGILLTLLTNLICYLLLHVSDYNGGLNYIYQSMFFAFCLLNPELEFRLYFLIPIKAKWLGWLEVAMMVVDIFDYMKFGKAGVPYALAIIVALVNLALIYSAVTGRSVFSRIKQMKRKNDFKKNMTSGGYIGGSASSAQNDRPRSTAEKHKNAVFNRNRGTQNDSPSKSQEFGATTSSQPAQKPSATSASETMRPRNASRHRCAVCGRTEITNPDMQFRFCTKCVGNYEYCEDHLYTHRHMGY